MRTRTLLLLVPFVLLPVIGATAETGALTLSDHVEIQQLYARYNHAWDSDDAKLLTSVYTPDGEFRVGSNKMKALGMIKGPVRTVPLVRHITTSILLNASPEGARGTAFLLLANLQATPPALAGGGFYEDVLVKTADGWRFKSRTFHSQAAPPQAAAAK